jgi:hypothetical protein
MIFLSWANIFITFAGEKSKEISASGWDDAEVKSKHQAYE